MSDNINTELPQVQTEKRQRTLSRRDFLKVFLAGAGGLLLPACVPDSLATLVPPTQAPPSPPSPEVTRPTEAAATSTPEVLTPNEEMAIMDYERFKQTVYLRQNPDGSRSVAKCDPPVKAEDITGFVYSNEEFDWGKLKLPEITVGGQRLPILTSRTDCDQATIEFLERWYQDPSFVEMQIKNLNLPVARPAPINALLVHYKSTRDSYWQQSSQGCEKVFNNSPEYDPQELYNHFSRTLVEDTDGAVNYRQVAPMEVIAEEDMPLTEDPNLTFPDLLSAYKRSMNHQKLAEMAVRNGATTIIVYSGPSAGMYENRVWIDENSGKQVRIFAFNYDRTYDLGVHAWMHFFENQVRNSPMGNIYLKCVGRDQEYGLPYIYDYSEGSNNKQNERLMNDGKTYAAVGLGTVHLTANSVYQYHYDSPIHAVLPGNNSPIDKSLWGE